MGARTGARSPHVQSSHSIHGQIVANESVGVAVSSVDVERSGPLYRDEEVAIQDISV
jgi:hypothetical protein